MIAILRCTFFYHSATIYDFKDDRKDQINKEIANKEIRVLDMNVLLNYASQIKKEREDSNRTDFAEDNEYRKLFY